MLLFANGSIAAIDEQGQQLDELQMKTAIQLWADLATNLGYDVSGCECRTQSPGGPGTQSILQPDELFGGWKEFPSP